MYKKYFPKIFLSSFCLFLCFLSFCLQGALAQSNEVFIKQYPSSPRAGDEVKLTVESDKYNLDRAKITWTVDGVEADSGVGRRTYILRVSNDKAQQIVSVRLEEDGLNDGAAQRVVELTSDFILVEGANMYTPPFYKGRKIPVQEGSVRVGYVSFGSGEINNFNGRGEQRYIWKLSGDEKRDISGPGKSVNILEPGIIDKNLDLSIIKTDESGQKDISQNISLGNTEVVVKKTDSEKLFWDVLSDTETSKSIYLSVEPYFFSVDSKKSPLLKYTWKLNNVPYPISTPWSVVFSGKDPESVKVNLDLENTRKLTQKNSRGFTFKIE